VTGGAYRYRSEVLELLLDHGLMPRPSTPPERAYELLKSIYAFEVRELNRLRREEERVTGRRSLDAYRAALRALRRRYPVLELPAHHWVERG
jgi:hypothetical protein